MHAPAWIGRRFRPAPFDLLDRKRRANPLPAGAPDRALAARDGLWQRLPEDTQALFNDGSVATGEVGIHFPDAYVERASGGRRAIVVHSGVHEFFGEVSRALYTQANIWKSPTEKLEAESLPLDKTVENIALIFSNLMEAYRVGGAIKYPLGTEQSELADMMALHAEMFVFAHEVGHVLIGRSMHRSSELEPAGEEYEADRIALEIVLGNLRPDPALVRVRRMVFAGAIFAVRVYAGLERIGYRFQGTHPPPGKRVRALREHAIRLLGGRPRYLRLATTCFSIDRLMEAVEQKLAGFDPDEKKDQILANIMAVVIECAAGHQNEENMARIVADDLADALARTQREVAEEAAAMFCPMADGRSPSGASDERAPREAKSYALIVAGLPQPVRDLFAGAWDRAGAARRGAG